MYKNFIKVLHIDLETGKIRIDKREDLMDYLGGVGVGIKLLEENVKPELDALDPQQPIILAIGAASTVYPVITKVVALFKSPHTGELGESYAGGRLAMAILMSGYDAIVITGKAKHASYLSITKSNVEIKDARAAWGMKTDIGRLIREREGGRGKRSIIRIGPAGENGVTYSSVCVDTYRHFGRLGLGAVFGSKLLKAISIIGDDTLPIQDFKRYFKVYQGIYKSVTETEIMGKYHDLGTPINVEPLNASGGLPTKNLRQNVFEHGSDISGEAFAQKNLVRKVACTGCPVGCIHVGQFRREFDKGHEYEAISVGYDFELIFALGSFLGIKTTDEILELIEAVEEAGMDAMSTGVVLGWATEATMKGLVTQEDTIIPLAFGHAKHYIQAIHHIANRTNAFYHVLGEGADAAATRYGGAEFAMTFAKNEMSGYHTGYGTIVGSVVGARHSHLCNGGYSLDQSMKVFDPDVMVDKLFEEEVERCMLNSLIICLFARKVYDRQTIVDALGAIGRSTTNEELTEIAKRIYRTKIRVKRMLGYDDYNVTLPKRLFQTPSMTGQLEESVAYDLIDRYRKKLDAFMAEEA
jgi:aldehyde:ferredoxin oxidoreductase